MIQPMSAILGFFRGLVFRWTKKSVRLLIRAVGTVTGQRRPNCIPRVFQETSGMPCPSLVKSSLSEH
jgi:hypothetical protein